MTFINFFSNSKQGNTKKNGIKTELFLNLITSQILSFVSIFYLSTSSTEVASIAVLPSLSKNIK
jgi:hypothetical protein